MFETLDPVEGIIRFRPDHDNTRIERLESLTGPHHGTAGTHGGDEVRDPAAGLLPDLPGGGIPVRPPVGGVVVLIGFEVQTGVLLQYSPRLKNGTVGTFPGVGEHDVGSVCCQNGLTFARDTGGHGQTDRIPESSTDHGVGDACIAGGRVENHLAGSQTAVGKAFKNHAASRAILDGSSRIEGFELGVEGDPGWHFRITQAQQRCIANLINDGPAHCPDSDGVVQESSFGWGWSRLGLKKANIAATPHLSMWLDTPGSCPPTMLDALTNFVRRHRFGRFIWHGYSGTRKTSRRPVKPSKPTRPACLPILLPNNTPMFWAPTFWAPTFWATGNVRTIVAASQTQTLVHRSLSWAGLPPGAITVASFSSICGIATV